MLLDTLKNNRLILGIIGTILLVIIIGTLIAALTAQTPTSITSETSVDSTPSQITDEEIQQVVEAATPVENTADFANLVDDSLIEQPVPNDDALIKDELVQLEDIDTQLNEQKAMLDQQHLDADALIKLKEEQLANLEKQLAAQ